MIGESVKKAFNFDIADAKPVTTGLINATFIVNDDNGKQYLLQKINTNVFKNPLAIQENYRLIEQHLKAKGSFQLPGIIKTTDENLLFEDEEKGVWRVFEYIPDSYSPLASTTMEEAALVADCFGKFSNDLTGLDTSKIQAVLPGFHDLAWRYSQFEESLQNASAERKEKAEMLIDKAYAYNYLVDYYNRISKDKENYPLHILHHDCKIANILFNKNSKQIICPVDLDTTQNGLFFSDIGDMIRSMAPSIPEGSREIETMELRKDFYNAIKEHYLKSMKEELTPKEVQDIDMAGKVIVYMQSLRFLADYLNNDVYYKTEYPEQNYFRAANQFKLLDLIADYTK